MERVIGWWQRYYYLIWVLILMVCLVVLYGRTMAQLPIGYADSDELTMAAYLAGVPHPPSYPLFIWLLHDWLQIPTGLSVAVQANWFTALTQLLSLVMVYFGSLRVLRTSKLHAVLVTVGVGLLAMSTQFWWHSNLTEVFGLNHLLFASWWLTVIYLLLPEDGELSDFNTVKWWWVVHFVLLGLGMGHHPTFRLLALVTVYVMWWYRKAWKWLLLGGLGSIFLWVVSYGGLLLSLNSHGASYSWFMEPSLRGLWDVFMYQIYTSGGSAVETLTGEYSFDLLMNSLRNYILFMLNDMSVVGLLLGGYGFWWLGNKHRILGMAWLLTWLLTGPVIVLYMKFPIAAKLGDASYFWGLALRYRMLLLSEFVWGWAGIVGLVGWWHEQVYSSSQWLRNYWVVGGLGMALLIGVGYWQYDRVDLSETNFVHYYAEKILSDLPNDVMLVVDDDFVFSLLYKQLVEGVRTDVTIVPATYQMRWHYFYPERMDYLGLTDHDSDHKLAHMIAWNLDRGRTVYTYALRPEVIELLGLEANPFYGRPEGYVIAIDTYPVKEMQSLSSDYGLTVQLLDQEPETDWDRGWYGHLGYVHTTIGYLWGRQGETELAQTHLQIAEQMMQLEHNKQLVRDTVQYLTQSRDPSYLSIPPASAEQWAARAMENIDAAQYEEALWAAQRSTYKDPTNLGHYALQAEIASQLGMESYVSELLSLYQQLEARKLGGPGMEL